MLDNEPDSNLSNEEREDLESLVKKYTAFLPATECTALFEMIEQFASDIAVKNRRDGLRRALNKAWIPLTSLKPPPDSRVLTYSPTAEDVDSAVAIATFHQEIGKGQWWQLDGSNQVVERNKITHWQSLPRFWQSQIRQTSASTSEGIIP